jgi:hypothetical protein
MEIDSSEITEAKGGLPKPRQLTARWESQNRKMDPGDHWDRYRAKLRDVQFFLDNSMALNGRIGADQTRIKKRLYGFQTEEEPKT